MRFHVLFSGLAFLFFSISAQSQGILPYYGADFSSAYSAGQLKDQALLNALYKIISGGHIKNGEGPDKLVSQCAGQENCEQHHALGYDGARKKMFGKLYLEQVGGVYAVKDVYCERTFTDKDFGGKPSIGPGMIPDDGSILNTEHTWPQSKFTGQFSKEMQKSDLHHLFPSDSKMNSDRGNFHFGNVVEDKEKLKCPIGRLGRQKDGEMVFEAPMNHRGNVARALFYFATRYQIHLSGPEETALREWQTQDPVDDAELAENGEIEKMQGNRNPFIDMPTLVDHIQHF